MNIDCLSRNHGVFSPTCRRSPQPSRHADADASIGGGNLSLPLSFTELEQEQTRAELYVTP